MAMADTEWRSMVSSLIKETELNLERVKRVEALTQLPLTSPSLSMQPRHFREVDEVETRTVNKRAGAAALVNSQRVTENVRSISERLEYQAEVVEVLVDAVAGAKRERDAIAREAASMRDRVSFLEDALERAESDARKERDKSKFMRTELDHWKSGVESELNHFRGVVALVTRSVSTGLPSSSGEGSAYLSMVGDDRGNPSGIAAIGRLSRELADAMRVNKEEHDALLRQVQGAVGQCAKFEATLTSMEIGARDAARKIVALQRRVEAAEESIASTGGTRLLANEGARKEVADLRRMVKDMLAKVDDQQRLVESLGAALADQTAANKNKTFAQYFAAESPRAVQPLRQRGASFVLTGAPYASRVLDPPSDVTLGPADITSASLGGSVAFESVGADDKSMSTTENDVSYSENTNSLLSRSSGRGGNRPKRDAATTREKAGASTVIGGGAASRDYMTSSARRVRGSSGHGSGNASHGGVQGESSGFDPRKMSAGEHDLDIITAVDSSHVSDGGHLHESWTDDLSFRSGGDGRR